MDTKNWFGEHAASIRLIALAGGIALAAIILLDILTHKKSASGATSATPATGADTSPATSGTSATSTLQNPGETYISILEDYSSHVDNTTTDTTTTPYLPRPVLPIREIGHPIPRQPVRGFLPPTLPGPVAAQPIVATVASAPSSPHGGPVPVPTPHPSEQYTVKSGDTLWGIAQRFLGNGADWRQLYDYNRSTVGSNPNRIYPGEVLNIQN